MGILSHFVTTARKGVLNGTIGIGGHNDCVTEVAPDSTKAQAMPGPSILVAGALRRRAESVRTCAHPPW